MSIIPQDYLAVLALAITFVSHKIRADQLPNNTNSWIAGAAIVLIVIITAWMTGGFTPDLRTDVLLCCSIALSLASVVKELIDLLNYQAAGSSPLAPQPPTLPPARG